MSDNYTTQTWTDEVLAGDERYDIKEDGGSAFKSTMRIELATAVAQAGTAFSAERMNHIESGIAGVDSALTAEIGAINAALGSSPEGNYADVSERLNDSVVRNLIINGGRTFAQRQAPATLTTVSDAKCGADRFKILSGGGIVQHRLYTPSDSGYSATGLSAANYSQIKQTSSSAKIGEVQIVEADTSIPYIGRTIRVKGKFRSNTARDIKVALLAWSGTANSPTTDPVSAWNSDGSDPSFVANYTVVAQATLSLTTAFQGVSLSAVVPSGAKNIAWAWWTINAVAVNGYIEVSECAIEHGSGIGWNPRHAGIELALCQRYGEPMPTLTSGVGQCYSSTLAGINVEFKTEKRVSPTLANATAGDFSLVAAAGGGATVTSLSVSQANTKRAVLYAYVSSGLVAGNATSLGASTLTTVPFFEAEF